MSKTKFSVSMCVYGGDNPKWFKESIDSILEQTVVPDEIVLVVDGPISDELNDVIALYQTKDDFKVIRLEVNKGHGEARRVGLDACSYELVALMDADDISVPDRFEKQIFMFDEHPEISVVGGDIAEFIGTIDNIVAYRRVPQTDIDIKRYIKKRCPFNQMTVMFRKSMYDIAGGYLDWYCDEDYYLWLRMMLQGAKFANVKSILCNVRVGKEMYQRRGGIKYFKSEAKLQWYMLINKIIGVPTYIANCTKRLIVQVILPNKLRGWVFQKFARKKV